LWTLVEEESALKKQSMLLVAMLATAVVVATPVLAQVSVAMVDCLVGGQCIGTAGNDTITGSDKQDIIFALEGDDVIDPGSDLEPDYVFCGPGFDVVNQEAGLSPSVLQYASEPDGIAEDCEERVL
jgi:hypothetical protein